jgi:undecaprenyl diphosphate synthase
VIGRLNDLPGAVRGELQRVMADTRDYDQGEVIFALSYGGRAELTDAVRAIGQDIKAGRMRPEEITEQTVADHLYLPDVPDPDLMIRTSGEQRISNFLLWQLSYAELYFEPAYWPDFREEHFQRALEAYRNRKRRFGNIR